MIKRIVGLMTICAAAAGLAIMQSSTPSDSHPLVILLVFLLGYVSLAGVLTYVLLVVQWVLCKTAWRSKSEGRAGFARLFMYGSVMAMAPIILIAIQSIGGVELYEMVLVTVFEAVALFYIRRQ